MYFQIIIQAEESDLTVPAEYGGNRWVAGILEALLKTRISTRRSGRFKPVSWMAMEMRQEAVAVLFKLDEQAVRVSLIAQNTQEAPLAVAELKTLV